MSSPPSPSSTSTPSSSSATAAPPEATFAIVDTIKDPDGLVATITERVKDGKISFAISREFTADGETKRTNYLARRHLPAVRRLLIDLEDRLELAEDRSRAKRRAP